MAEETSPDRPGHPRYPPKPDWDLWQGDKLPAVKSAEFQALIHRKPAVEGVTLNSTGDVIDEHGNIIGKLTAGDPQICKDQGINVENDVVDAHGVAIGRVDLLSELESREPQPEGEFQSEVLKAERQQMVAERDPGEKKPELGTQIEDQCATWDSAPNSKCYASFGDQGTTASVGAYGHLMQVSQYLEAGRSGMFAMGSRTAEEPRWPVDRARKLEDMSHSRSTTTEGMSVGLELKIKGLRSRKRQPQLNWVNWRWPRFEYTLRKGKLKISVQWMVRDHTVLQQWTVTNNEDEDMFIPIEFGRDMWIQDLEYLDYHNSFNDRSDAKRGQYGTAGPRDYGWILIHPFDEPMRKATSTPFTTLGSDSVSTQPAHRSVEQDSRLKCKMGDRDQTKATPVEVLQESQSGDNCVATAIMAVFVNGSARQFGGSDPSGGLWTERLKGHANLEVTAAYKMILVPAATIDYRNFLIPPGAANVTQFLLDEHPILLYSLSKIDLGNKPGHVGADLKSDGLSNPPAQGATSPGPSKANNENAAHGSRPSNTVIPTQLNSSEEPRRVARPSGCPETTLSPRSHLDFAIWRNLEHILSVCAISLRTPPLIESLENTKPGLHTKEEMVAVALTCGDFAGHRLYNPASFFAFEFLMDIAQRLEHVSATNITQQKSLGHLQCRIRRVCKGHIFWLLYKAEIGKETGCLKGDYFVTGRAVPTDNVDELDNVDSFGLKDTVTDNPLQIIKAFNFIKYYHGPGDMTLANAFLKAICLPWVSMLEKTDKRAKYAWPHRKTDGINVFRLDDHVWIWKAFKALEEAGVWKKEPQDVLTPGLDHAAGGDSEDEEDDEDEESDGDEAVKDAVHYGPEDEETTKLANVERQKLREVAKKAQADEARLSNVYFSAEVQAQMLQRFTVLESDVTKKRMLSVTRSTQQTRFLFHAKDTALFYGAHWGCFSSSNGRPGLWKATIEAQKRHSEDDETEWDNAIRYGLGIIMGTNNFSIGGLEPRELVRRAVEVLFKSTSPNGFFPGQLDETDQRPTLFYRDQFRDFYFHASFEIPYILLTHAKRICAFYEPKALDAPPILLSPAKYSDTRPPQYETAPPVSLLSEHHEPREAANPGPAQATQRDVFLKKAMPFGTRVDQNRIVEMTDEWLYNYPEFLEDDGEIETKFEDAVKTISDHKQGLESSASTGTNWWEEMLKKVTSKTSSPVPEVELWLRIFNQCSEGSGPAAVVVDTGQKKRNRRREADRLEDEFVTDWVAENQLFRHVLFRSPRTAATAKKRLVWLPGADLSTAFICYAAAPDVGKSSLFRFFDRHSTFENFFNDDTARISNTWETEMHLSFYMMTISEAHAPNLEPEDRWTIHSPSQLVQADFPGSKSVFGLPRKQIARASLGFHFIGDFFDRYWTCHFIEQKPTPTLKWNFQFDIQSKRNKDKSWRQRRVLELYLSDRILDLMLSGSEGILEEARQVLNVQAGLLAYNVRDGDFRRRIELWESIQPILQTVHDELSKAVSTLSKWAVRDQDRQGEAPRWTRNDERKYRGILNKLGGSTSRKMADVRRVLDRIDSLEKFLDSYFDKTRTRHSNDNMVTFTYVTVIFLPLGFAASIFSMGGAPDTELLVSMVVCATVAFLLTVIILMNAKRLLGALNRLLNVLKWMIIQRLATLSERMKSSRIFRSYRQRHHPKSTEQELSQLPEQHQGSAAKSAQSSKDVNGLEKEMSLHWLFWPVYLLIEVPARHVLEASRALYGQKSTSTWITASHVALGIAFLPLFITSWIMQFICYNAMDLIHLTICTITRGNRLRPNAVIDKNEKKMRENMEFWNQELERKSTDKQMSKLAYPLESSRPLRRHTRNRHESENK